MDFHLHFNTINVFNTSLWFIDKTQLSSTKSLTQEFLIYYIITSLARGTKP